MKALKIYPTVFLTGGIAYCLLETLWRGYTHISMGLAGGICLMGLYCIDERFEHVSVFLKAGVGALLITAVEFIFGCVVNLMMGLSVWDYSHMYMNILGQVCPLFTIVWFFICFPAFWLCRGIHKLFGINGEKHEQEQ